MTKAGRVFFIVPADAASKFSSTRSPLSTRAMLFSPGLFSRPMLLGESEEFVRQAFVLYFCSLVLIIRTVRLLEAGLIQVLDETVQGVPDDGAVGRVGLFRDPFHDLVESPRKAHGALDRRRGVS